MIDLRPMSDQDYKEYYGDSIVQYAQDMASAGNVSPEEAQAASEKQFNDLLPKGLDSAGQHLMTIWDVENERCVGMVWVGERKRRDVSQAVIYDIRVAEDLRGQGYGTQALEAVEAKVHEMGFPEIWRHVFGHNTGARKMYERLGYEVANVTMRKNLET